MLLPRAQSGLSKAISPLAPLPRVLASPLGRYKATGPARTLLALFRIGIDLAHSQQQTLPGASFIRAKAPGKSWT